MIQAGCLAFSDLRLENCHVFQLSGSYLHESLSSRTGIPCYFWSQVHSNFVHPERLVGTPVRHTACTTNCQSSALCSLIWTCKDPKDRLCSAHKTYVAVTLGTLEVQVCPQLLNSLGRVLGSVGSRLSSMRELGKEACLGHHFGHLQVLLHRKVEVED